MADASVSLHDYFERVLAEMEKRYQQRFESQERAVQEYKATSETRLGTMNEFRGTISDAQAKYITRSEAVAMVMAGCALTAVVLAAATFLFTFFLHR